MVSRFNLIVFFILFSSSIFSQKSDAFLLLEEGKYSLSQQLFISEFENSNFENDKYLYHIAKCSDEINNKDAKWWYQKFLLDFPNSDFTEIAKKDLAFICFTEKDYAKTHEYLINLKKEELKDDEYYFKLAYSLFEMEQFDDSKFYFSKIKSHHNKYKTLATYYYAHIAYKQELYKTALSHFELLQSDNSFGSIVPYYISQIHFYQKNYRKLVDYMVPILENVIQSRKEEINRLIAESYYQLAEYENAEIYFENYLSLIEGTPKMIDYFQMGQINIFISDYKDAIYYLEKVDGLSDSLSQFASYYLGKAYVETGEKNFALQAFNNSSFYNFDMELKEEALFNYAKLSYELDLPYNNLTSIADQLDALHFSKYKKEVKRLFINMFQSTNQYQKAFDFLKVKHLPDEQEKQILQRLSYYIGVQHYNNANYNNALLMFEYSRKYPLNKEIDVMCVYYLGDCYYQLKDFEKSINNYSAFLKTPSNSFFESAGIVKYNLGYSYFQSKNYKKSKEWFRKAVNSEIDKKRMHDAKLRLADSYYMLSDFENAAHSYHRSGLDIHMKESHFDMDYSVYQESKCYGLISDYQHQEKCLKAIIREVKESPYYQRALMDLATLYKNQNRSAEALIQYDNVLEVSNSDEVISLALLSKGLIYFNADEIESSISCLKQIITDYPKTTSFKQSLLGLQNVYMEISKIDEYLTFVKTIPSVDIAVSAQDSLMYQSAYNQYSDKNYEGAKSNFNNYLEKFTEDGIFTIPSTYYLSESCLKTNDTLSAVGGFQILVGYGASIYLESSLVHLSRILYDVKDYSMSNKYYQMLDTVASSNSLKREAVIRLMYGYETENDELAVSYSGRVLELQKVDERLIARAKIIIARSDFENGNFARASSLCNEIVSLTTNTDGTEAMYKIVYFTYLEEDYEKTEELIFEMADKYSSDHWIAMGFVLLADVYVKQQNNYQAKATLESIIENHDGEDVVNIAREKWENIVERESLNKVDIEQTDATIEIGVDEFNYEINYSDLQIDEEF